MKTLTSRALAAALLGVLAAATGAQQALPAPAVAAQPAAASPLAGLPAPDGEAMAHTCAACHGTQGRLGDEAFMPLAGMPAEQFVRSMQAFRSGQRPATLMGMVARGFTDADLQAMAAYFARQAPADGSSAAMVGTPPAARESSR